MKANFSHRKALDCKIGDNKIKVVKGEESYEKEMDVAPFIDAASSSTLIPLRFVSEHLGYKVSWNGETQEITIEK